MCEHHNFSANVNVVRLEDTKQFMAEITVKCAECGKPFQFLGLSPGLDTGGASVSVDGLEAQIAICPEGSKPNPFQRMAFGITRTQ
jgi:hypothetical protein